MDYLLGAAVILGNMDNMELDNVEQSKGDYWDFVQEAANFFKQRDKMEIPSALAYYGVLSPGQPCVAVSPRIDIYKSKLTHRPIAEIMFELQ